MNYLQSFIRPFSFWCIFTLLLSPQLFAADPPNDEKEEGARRNSWTKITLPDGASKVNDVVMWNSAYHIATNKGLYKANLVFGTNPSRWEKVGTISTEIIDLFPASTNGVSELLILTQNGAYRLLKTAPTTMISMPGFHYCDNGGTMLAIGKCPDDKKRIYTSQGYKEYFAISKKYSSYYVYGYGPAGSNPYDCTNASFQSSRQSTGTTYPDPASFAVITDASKKNYALFGGAQAIYRLHTASDYTGAKSLPNYTGVFTSLYTTGTKGYAASDKGYVYRTIDGGNNWVYYAHGLKPQEEIGTIYDMTGFGNTLYAATDWGVYTTSTSGTQADWQRYGTLPYSAKPSKVCGTYTGIIVTTDKGVFTAPKK